MKRHADNSRVSNRRVRILFLIDEIVGKGAGTERQLLGLIARLDRQRFDPVLCCLRESEWLRENDPGCESFVLGFRSFHGSTFLPSLLRLARFVRRTGVDVVHTFFVDASLLGPVAARLGRARGVAAWRRDMGYWHTKPILWALRLVDLLLDRVLVNALAVGEVVAAAEWMPRERILIVPNGVDLDRFGPAGEQDRARVRSALLSRCGASPDSCLVGVVANLRPVKRIDDFIRAAALVRRVKQGVRFIIVGKGALEQELVALAGEEGVDGAMHLIDDCDDPALLLPAFDVGVLPSDSEGCSNTLLEYMAAGLGVVATRVGGNSELIEDGKSGLLVERGRPEQLAGAILRLLEEPGLRARLGRRARATVVERHSEERMVEDVERVILDLAKRDGDGPGPGSVRMESEDRRQGPR